jgi:hypothetical protein
MILMDAQTVVFVVVVSVAATHIAHSGLPFEWSTLSSASASSETSSPSATTKYEVPPLTTLPLL